MKDYIKKTLLKVLKIDLNIESLNDFYVWQNIYKFQQPLPQFVKEIVLNKYNSKNSIWVETGTYLGRTTKYLSKISHKVYSLEPDNKLFNQAKKNLNGYANVTLFNVSSESGLEEILKRIKKENLCFWLDGHYSGKNTFKGETDTPINKELEIIEKYLDNFLRINILIDDFRLFKKNNNSNEEYPDKTILINWANKNNMEWTVESDIFVIQSKGK